ncbi:Dedicator of cytokinesis protein 3 [Liparis tanakae]|uniref:Dedicator of cytokinesis protein 3 n=1 Tax=Liparis tanakae TaxID=230148 RepID=A0A4Z2F169_9TELE|nr:Dedicator of cytokinesis protein 3 [Liparis tanakae]
MGIDQDLDQGLDQDLDMGIDQDLDQGLDQDLDMGIDQDLDQEAAFTLLLYWELLQWEDRPLRDFLHYPCQSEWQRKENLSRKILHYFNKGKAIFLPPLTGACSLNGFSQSSYLLCALQCWEYGISLCRELAFQYETLYDYQSLSWIRKMEAAYYDNIIEQQRIEPEFFRMGFYGRKFPFFLRNKEFVCRGYDYERLEDFQQRMLGEFPQAIAMQHPNQPDDTILQSDAQCILLDEVIGHRILNMFRLLGASDGVSTSVFNGNLGQRGPAAGVTLHGHRHAGNHREFGLRNGT